MDPNELLAKLRRVADEGRKFAEEVQLHPDGMSENEESLSGLVVELSSHFWALDMWMVGGGFPPDAWTEALKRAAAAWQAVSPPPLPRSYRHRPLVVPPEPLGGPVPGVGGSHLPEGEH